MKLALILSAILAAVQGNPINSSSSFTSVMTPMSYNITSNKTVASTTVLPITPNVTMSIIISPVITSNTTMSSTMMLPTTSSNHTTPSINPITMMPNNTTISCFNHEYKVNELNTTIIQQHLKKMIMDKDKYTKEFPEDRSNSTVLDNMWCGLSIYHNNTDDKYRIAYSAFNKSFCTERQKSKIICNDNHTCNKTLVCCESNNPRVDNNCNNFIIEQVNDTKNNCMASNSSECYQIVKTNFVTTMPVTVSTTKSGAGNVISAYILMLASAILSINN